MASGSGEAEGPPGARSLQNEDAETEGSGALHFYLITPSSAKAVVALVIHGGGSRSTVVNFSEMEPPEGAKRFLGDTRCWQPDGPTTIDLRYLNDGSSIRVIAIFSKTWWKLLVEDAARWLSQLSGGRMDGQTERTFALRTGRLQIEVFRGDAAASRNYSASLSMAIVTNLSLLSNSYNVSDCFREYAHHRLRFLWSSVELKTSAEWFQWIQQALSIGCDSDSVGTSQATKTVLALIYLLESLRRAEHSNNLDKKLLVKSYEALLSPLRDVTAVLSTPETMPPFAAQELQVGVSHIVAFTSPHSVMWSSCLDALCSADPSYSFLWKWTAGKGDLQEANQIYEIALYEVFLFADAFQDKSFKSLAIRAAVLAAPTTLNLFRSLRTFYCPHVLFTDSSEEAEEDLSGTYGHDLVHRFRELTQVENPGGMALLLLHELETEEEPMLTVLRTLSASFLASQVSMSGRTYFVETSARNGKQDGWEYFFNLIKCPHAFCLPLLQREITFISDVAGSRFSHLAADVILELAGKFEALHDHTDTDRIFELLRTWLQKVCTKAIEAIREENQAPMTPHLLCSQVADLFEMGLEGPGFVADCLGQILRMSLRRERFEIQTVLQSTGVVSRFPHSAISTQFHLHAEDMILKYLETESEGHCATKDMDKKAEDLLLWICSSSNGCPTVTGWIQEALCVALLNFMLEFYGENAAVSSEALVESGFLLLILQTEEAGPTMRDHALFKSASTALTKLFEELETESLLMDMVDKVMAYSQIIWQKVCKAQNLNTQPLRTAWKDVHDYREVLLKGCEMLLETATFLEGLGYSKEVLQENQSWLVERTVKCKHFSLKEIRGLDHWPVQLDMTFLKGMLTLEQSKVLKSILKSQARNISADILAITGRESLNLWTNVTGVMRSSLKCYNEEWHEISRPNCPVEKLSFLLDGITRSSVELEIELAEKYLRSCEDREAVSVGLTLQPLSSWVHLRDIRSLVDPLLKVESMFSIERDDKRILDTLQSLCDSCTSGTLDDFLVLYNKNIEVINYFSTREAVILKQLAESELLITFLKENSDDDLRVLTDAIEEQAEGAMVDEAIVSDLIHIDKVFRPLLQSPRFTMTHLKLAIETEVKGSLDRASQFAAKLNNCNANVQRIRHFVASLADRGSVLKDHMHKILKSGVYNFVLQSESEKADQSFCRLSVSCNGPSDHVAQNQFTLSDLRDLRSRAIMILSSKRMKPDLQFRLMDDNRLSDTVHALMEFVDHVNLAQKIVDQISTLHHSGHLFFEQVDWSISGLLCLKQIVEQLEAQIANWNAALLRSRELFSCLNFFTGTELRLIYSCFTPEASSTQIAICCELLQWAHPGLNTAQVQETLSKLNAIKPLECHSPGKFCQTWFSAWTSETVETGNGSKAALGDPVWETTEAGLEHLLKVLSDIIESAFATVKPEVIGRGELLLPNVNSGLETVLVSVQDEHRELNVVVEIFHRQGIRLRGNMNNLLLCSAVTSWEELHLLLLRYLAVHPTNSVSYTFIIAFVEKLSFECQLQLMSFLQQVSRTSGAPLKRQLVLVCSSSSPTLQGISHHLRVPVHYMNGYADGDILQYLPEECNQMKVVTSEVSGLGKTRSIFQQAVGSTVTLCVSGGLSRKSLIMLLKGLELTARDTLHLDVTTEEGYDNLNLLLFELLVCGALKSSHVGVYRLETSLVSVELANTLGNRLASNLSVCSWLPQQHLVWQLNSLQVSDDLESDEQVVCAYLNKMESNELDNMNIHISGVHVNVSALATIRCRQLLNTYFIKDSGNMSFSVLTGFIKVFSGQLRRLSATDFYSVETLRWMLRAEVAGTFRSTLVSSLLQAAVELSLRSVKPWLQMQQQQIVGQDMSTSMHDRMSSLLRWSESNHVMVFFDLYGPITVLYRDRNLIPQGIKTIMSIQVQAMGMDLKDYSTMSSEQLWQVLWPLLCKEEPIWVPNYALTPDNFLKMALISLRINARVPVIIMGETGCGKTSLLRALASSSSATFSTLTVHAGSTEQDIKSFIYSAEGQASSETGKVWAFVDEINACHHMGLLNGLLCHHSIDGRPLHSGLVVLAACNPYRLQDPRVQEVGLALPSGVDKAENHELAYKVQPLPEAMLDYVWDYGILSDSDERAYIASMVGQRSGDIVDLLSNSQMFMRTRLGVASVSLRDIQRWILLYDWFQIDIRRRPMLHRSSRNGSVEVRAKILASSMCYHSRFHGNKDRELYRKMCCYFLNLGLEEVIEASGEMRAPEVIYLDILNEEQMDILTRMEIPSGIARNEALLENVFVVLVSMLNHIPVFVVGKPGSGKTLALQIIYSSLRGTDSKDDYLKKLPRMLLLSYQGSQSSTSEGILKVFEKAHRYVLSNRERDILVVVVLDEVGLAETSQHNPLKVLHPLLEPDVQEVAVVGISNWSLDAAKMNRGIHLSQPDPGEEDLYQTSLAILTSYTGGNTHFLSVMIRSLVAAYHKYHSCQTRPNFHGLRDFYSLIKSLRKCKRTTTYKEQLSESLWRNFGGSIADTRNLFSIVEQVMGWTGLTHKLPPVTDLIKQNLQDTEARHLLLITRGDSASGILMHMLRKEEDFAVIRGSTYEDDKNEEYCYLMLSDIILHMEMGRCILLENADQIWSSLYDMLNQHYMIVGGRRHCRIALGSYSNPMCYVHDSFRCIVVVDIDQIPSMDPPFLNRFEKQVFTYESILDEFQKRAVQSVRSWAHELAARSCSNKYQDESQFLERQLFAGYYQDSVPSLVMLHSSQTQEVGCPDGWSTVIDRCKADLLRTAYVDAIARAHLSKSPDAREVQYWTGLFLSWPELQCLLDCLQAHIGNSENWADDIGVKMIVTTSTPMHWNVHLDSESIAGSSLKVQSMRLGDFTSERQLQAHIQQFWKDSCANLLIVQADDIMDKNHISLAKFHLDKARAACLAGNITTRKHMVFIIHVHLGESKQSNFSFLCGWEQLTLHQLQREALGIRDFLDSTITEILQHEAMGIELVMPRVLAWSFLCIKFTNSNISKSAAYSQEMVRSICKDDALVASIMQRALTWVSSRNRSLWQMSVLNNRKLLSTSASAHAAFLQYVEEQFREAVARLIYLLEKTSSVKSYFTYDTNKQRIWREALLKPEIIDCGMAPAPCYPEGYEMSAPMDLRLPFSSVYAAHIDRTFKEVFLETFLNHRLEDPLGQSKKLHGQIDAAVGPSIGDIKTCVQLNLDDYIADFATIYSRNIGTASCMSSPAFEWVLREEMGSTISHPSDLHVLTWVRGGELEAQATMASVCLSSIELKQEVIAMQEGRLPNRRFTEDLALRCYSNLLPTEVFLRAVGGTECWLQKVRTLLKLAPPVKSPRLVFLLQVLHDLTCIVILPLKMDSKPLCVLAAWLQIKLSDVDLPTILEKVLALLPDLSRLGEAELNGWLDFLCLMVNRYLEVASLGDKHVNAVISALFNWPRPTSMMGHVLFRVLKIRSAAAEPPAGRRCPNIVIFLLECNTVAGYNWQEDINHAGNILLSDRLYDDLRQTITLGLLCGEDTDTWDSLAFDKFLCIALTSGCEDAAHNLPRRLGAIALIKCFLYSVAALLVETCGRQNVKGSEGSDKMIILPASIRVLKTISPALRSAMQVFLMKVLHWELGQSASEILNLGTTSKQRVLFKDLSCLLDHIILRKATNRLGYDPFLTSSNAYVTAEMALTDLLAADSGRMDHLLKNVGGQEEEAAVVAAVASNLFLPKSGRDLSAAEQTSLKLLRDIVDQSSKCTPITKQSVGHLIGNDPSGFLHVDTSVPTGVLRFRCLAADVLAKVAALSADSPLRNYCVLNPSYFVQGHVLTAPEGALSAVSGIGKFKEYICGCGYRYIIGDCTRPNQVSICPQCKGTIGGMSHGLVPGNTELRTSTTGKVLVSSVVSNAAYCVRIQPRSYRLLRVLVNYCFLIGVASGKATGQLANFLDLPNEKTRISSELTGLIEQDLPLLDQFLACRREMTYQYMHCVVDSLSTVSVRGPFQTADTRDQWEMAFDRLIEHLPVQEAVNAYLERQGCDMLNRMLQERIPCLPDSLQSHFRMTRTPCFVHYESIFLQDTRRAAEYPCTTAMLAHTSQLDDLVFLLPIAEFSSAINDVLGNTLTRRAAAVTTIGEMLRTTVELQKLYPAFERCWNSVRHNVRGYECRVFKEPIPQMHMDQPVALCLLERKDQGIYLTAIFELLRTNQNAFLQYVTNGLLEYGSADKRFDVSETRSFPSVPIQLCKAEHLVKFELSWAEKLVRQAGMCELSYGKGTNVHYDDVQIELQVFQKLIQGKALLAGDYREFPYQQESFQRHATLISDVANLVPQEALFPETVSNIRSELAVEGSRAGQLLASLDLCLGFLRKTGADRRETLREYCECWLEKDSHLIFRKAVFDSVQVTHVVSLYEGLEDVASLTVEDLVSSSYGAPLEQGTLGALLDCVAVKNCSVQADSSVLGAEAFRDVLKRFMYRYLTSDTFNPEEGLEMYLTDPRLVRWPADDVDAQTLNDVFPSTLKLKHARAIYLALKEMCQ